MNMMNLMNNITTTSFYFYCFSWGFFFFSAGYFALKKLNEEKIIIRC